MNATDTPKTTSRKQSAAIDHSEDIAALEAAQAATATAQAAVSQADSMRLEVARLNEIAASLDVEEAEALKAARLLPSVTQALAEAELLTPRRRAAVLRAHANACDIATEIVNRLHAETEQLVATHFPAARARVVALLSPGKAAGIDSSDPAYLTLWQAVEALTGASSGLAELSEQAGRWATLQQSSTVHPGNVLGLLTVHDEAVNDALAIIRKLSA